MLFVITKNKYSTKFHFVQVNNELVVYEKPIIMPFLIGFISLIMDILEVIPLFFALLFPLEDGAPACLREVDFVNTLRYIVIREVRTINYPS